LCHSLDFDQSIHEFTLPETKTKTTKDILLQLADGLQLLKGKDMAQHYRNAGADR
jgi:hypothetical protein